MKWILGIAALLVLTSCSLPPEQKQALVQYWTNELKTGRITQEQFNYLVGLLDQSIGFREVLMEVGRTLGEIGLTLLGVRVWRGGIKARKGAAPTDG